MQKRQPKGFSSPFVLHYCLFIGFFIWSCNAKKSTEPVLSEGKGTLIALGFDQSTSVADYRKQDTVFVATVCRIVSKTGGLVVAYGIGDESDQSGLRCYLTPIPSKKANAVLSKQAELQRKVDAIKAENERRIHRFLENVQAQIFDPMNRAAKNTDINGFFKKVGILLNERANHEMNRYVFAYSDGVQSMKGKNTASQMNIHNGGEVTVCLAGWKEQLPCDSSFVLRFEAPEGFVEFLRSKQSL